MTDFVAQQRARLEGDWSQLVTPIERVYPRVARDSLERPQSLDDAKVQPSRRTVTLYRPTGPAELELVAQSGYLRWPPRLPEQPIRPPERLGIRHAFRSAGELHAPLRHAHRR